MLASRSAASQSARSLRVASPTAIRRASSSHTAPLTSLASTKATPRPVSCTRHPGKNHSIARRYFATEAPVPRKPLFDKILVANRGEIACRVIRTAKKLGIKTVAVYSEVDHNSLHVQLADEAYCIGPAPSSESYLRMDKIIEVAHRCGAQAVHPGYGFLSENANFAQLLADEGLVFIGPSPTSIRSMGSKSESKDIMTAAGVPCVPGYHGADQQPTRLLKAAEVIGFPVLIKAVMGGGGKGMRIVNSAAEFPDALESARREARKSFGDERVLVEKYIIRPRHVEVQVFGDRFGNVVSLWERDCSVQRRHQKIIEEAPAPGLTETLRADLCDKAVAAAKAVDYLGAGTVEFILDNDSQDFFFMEMNTRLQVEHPVTEMITGQDLVQWQLEVAAGNPLPLAQDEIPRVGHAFEARIYAENPRNNFLPDVGPLLHISNPHTSASVRIEEGFQQGSQIEVYYDPLIAKLVTHGRDRTEALRHLRKALEEYQVVGVSTNIEFLRSLACHDNFLAGDVETGFITKHHDQLFPPFSEPSAEVIAQAALFVTLREKTKPRETSSSSPWTTLSRRRFGADHYMRTVTFQSDELESQPIKAHVKSVDGNLFDIDVETPATAHQFQSVPAQLASINTVVSTLASHRLRTTVVSQVPHAGAGAVAAVHHGERLHVFLDGHKTTLVIPAPAWLQSLDSEVLEASKGGVKAPMPSLVVDVRVKVGDRIEKGQPVVILESMKTETVMRSDTAGVVTLVLCKKGEMVEEGRELVEIKPDE